MDLASEALDRYEVALCDLEMDLSSGDTAAVRVGMEEQQEAEERISGLWARMSRFIRSTTASATYSYPNYPGLCDSLMAQRGDVLGGGALMLSTVWRWLGSPQDEALLLLARMECRGALDRAHAYQGRLRTLLVDLFTMPSAAYLSVDNSTVPDGLALGDIGEIRSVVRNLGATDAQSVTMSVVTDTTKLRILPPRILSADLVAAGDSLICVWHVQMLEMAGEADTAIMVLGSLVADAPGALAEGGTFLIPVLRGGAINAEEPAALPEWTSLIQVYPNPTTDRHVLELAIASGQPLGSVQICDITGRLVWSQDLRGLAPGIRTVIWDGRDMAGRDTPASVYFLRVETPSGAICRKLLRIR